ncbi:efflux RND transporter periplasmic adaptor subunit [Rhizobium sp. S95]|uniref:Efflux RND transporter periplasmic adaptor subunit n=1 Tax=Ciceribacter sichuanensis TaxID=2949647 RepID=A0AAJ1BZP4_9HYPH|nr:MULTISPECIES: efflux RND transporter periplasmic adaptor subunit [unclassified Ciceribacter]MCM2398007.1 efflux RND transporter periplasmic adaptor subunit [Ciceribacter sp. S95]MCO5959187.1 efflux RND transporter periplasmic adaptor subunit [Ciceribacter sp. S101]
MKRRIHLTSAIVLLTAVIAGCSDSGSSGKNAGSAGAERPPSPVSVVAMKKAEHPLSSLLPGRADAFQTADIRPRVSGVIKQIAFKEGSEVNEGDLLYKIEDDTYRAEVAQAQASLAKAEASVPTAQSNLARYERLVNSGATQIEYENAKVTLLQAQADVAQAKAALNAAEINLALTDIKAPFEGVTSVSTFSIGNVVTANQTDKLTTLRRLDPIYIDLTESSANLLRLREAITAGRVNQPGGQIADIRLTMEDGTQYPIIGKLDMSEMAVSETTGTFSIRAVFDNPDNLILPGMYVRASVTVGKENGYLIPQRAATRNARGELTAKFVNAQNVVETRVFEQSSVSGNNWLVADGIADGDKLIVDGFQWIGDGATVAPVEATVDENGFVVEAPKAPEAAPAAKP